MLLFELCIFVHIVWVTLLHGGAFHLPLSPEYLTALIL